MDREAGSWISLTLVDLKGRLAYVWVVGMKR
jgi:hypothetical protein